ncbi:hypothetical protein NN561_015366 [Cricetulus griseus]
METPTEASSESGARPSLGHLRIRPSPSRPCPWLPGLNGGPRGVSVLGTQSGNAKDTGACTECFLFVGPRALPGFGCRLKNPEVFDRRTCRKFHSKFGDLDQALVAAANGSNEDRGEVADEDKRIITDDEIISLSIEFFDQNRSDRKVNKEKSKEEKKFPVRGGKELGARGNNVARTDGRAAFPGRRRLEGQRSSVPPLSFISEQHPALQGQAAPRAPPLPARAQAARNREAILRVRRSPRAALRSADEAPAKFESEIVRPHRTREADGLCRLAEPELGGERRPLQVCSLRTGLLDSEAVHAPGPRGHRGARLSRRSESRVDPVFNPSLHDNRLFVASSARFSAKALSPSPTRCPQSLESGFCWMGFADKLLPNAKLRDARR